MQYASSDSASGLPGSPCSPLSSPSGKSSGSPSVGGVGANGGPPPDSSSLPPVSKLSHLMPGNPSGYLNGGLPSAGSAETPPPLDGEKSHGAGAPGRPLSGGAPHGPRPGE